MHSSFKLLLFVPLAALLLFSGMLVSVICINHIPYYGTYKWIVSAGLLLALYFITPYEEKYIWKKKDEDPALGRELPAISTMFVVGMIAPLWTNIPELINKYIIEP